MLPLDIHVRREGRATRVFLFECLNIISAGAFVFAFGQVYCVDLHHSTLRWVGFLVSEGRTSAQRKNRAGRGHSVGCWLFAVPDKSELLARPLCKWGCVEHVLGMGVMGIPWICRSQALVWLYAVLPCTDASGFPGILAAVETKSLAVWLWGFPVLQD